MPRKAPKGKAPRPSEVIPQQLRRWRKIRGGMSVKQLADRVEALGGDLSRVTITKIENGWRGISVDEALLLAAALNVPPPVLFFPFESGTKVAVTPKSVIHPDLAWRWLAGDDPLASTERWTIGAVEWREGQADWERAALPLDLYRTHREVFDVAARVELRIDSARRYGTEADVRKAESRFEESLVPLARVRRKMELEGIKPPKVESRWAPQLRRAAKRVELEEVS
jgi:hypothetical protein